jgi:hypothetical protein
MAIVASKLGILVAEEWHSDSAILQRLREKGLVREKVADEDLYATFKQARGTRRSSCGSTPIQLAERARPSVP